MYQMFIQDKWMIPAAADLTGVPEADIQKTWDRAVKETKLCIINVPGDLPTMKKCPVCELNVRQDAKECKTPDCSYYWVEAE